MNYILSKDVITAVPRIEITEAEYVAFRAARNVLTNAFSIEENYELLIANYDEFEKEVVTFAVESVTRNHRGYDHVFRVTSTLNRRLVSVLTSARTYVDTLYQHMRECLPSDATKTIVQNLFSSEYDKNFDYRFMEALRNHVQHHDLPIRWYTSASRRTSLTDDSLMEFSIEAGTARKQLASNDGFKKAVLAELPDKINLIVSTRGYVESLSHVHAAAQALIEKATDEARKTIEAAHDKYKKEFDGSLVGLSASQWDGAVSTESIPLLLDWDNVRLNLQRVNRPLVNLRKQYITSKPG